jgi:hypothetical protein
MPPTSGDATWRYGEGFKVSPFHAATILVVVGFGERPDCRPQMY